MRSKPFCGSEPSGCATECILPYPRCAANFDGKIACVFGQNILKTKG
ncbi:hypothetical protein BACCAP_00477 [Pseudoflavonifractor capillosus ATCC 29799]|uniref:Uncharacterized protein n=1 Tax=Pseudoflavonifractor capillosus ATCC 29799 TaxID=411467 RepID=A6NQK7_9FIRM|nr:hypothetical protein BACCAP_00477 [Pseudoflavonifractor capillosus ATCC 29799]